MPKKPKRSRAPFAGGASSPERVGTRERLEAAARWGAVDLLAGPLSLALLVAVARMPILTPDVWWHLATGRLVARDGIPHRDPFSYTLGERSWTAHEWLADRVLFASFESGGFLGVVLWRAALITAAVMLAYLVARLRGRVLWSLVLLIPAAWAMQRNWLDRPQLWTFVLAPLILGLLEAHRMGRRRGIYLVPLLFAAWVNLHGGFMFGLGIVAVWVVGELWRARSDPTARAGLRSLWIAASLGVVATLVNPNTFEGATYPLRYVGSGLSQSLQEERPGALDSGYAWVHFGVLVALLVALVARLRHAAPQHVVLGVALAWISMPRLGGSALPFAAERHAPLLLLLGTPLLVWQVSALFARYAAAESAGLRRVRSMRLAWGAGAGLVLVALAWALAVLPRQRDADDRVAPARFPAAAALWLQDNRLPGNLINPYRWGGYLAFYLHPEYRVWIDSRGDLYGVDRIREFELLYRMPPGAEQHVTALLDRYDANVIVWHLLTIDFGPLQVHPFAAWLLRSKEWRLVFFDHPDPARPDQPSATTGIFLREHPRNAALLERHKPVRTPRLPRAPLRSPAAQGRR